MDEDFARPRAGQTLAEDWATLWQSELAAIAADPETLLVLTALSSAWLRAARGLDAARARTDAAPWPAAAGAAAGARNADPHDARIERLQQRLGELERRLDRLGPGSGSVDRSGSGGTGAGG